MCKGPNSLIILGVSLIWNQRTQLLRLQQ
jgi:hypothetical protein